MAQKSCLDLVMFNPKRKSGTSSKKVQDKVVEILAQRDSEDSSPVVLVSQNEGRFDRINAHRLCWALKGIGPKAPRQVVRARICVCRCVHGFG